MIEGIAIRKRPGDVVNVLTHCNAGWLATVDCGTALAPVYAAHDKGIAVHVFVDETRPRNQGAALTAWELLHHGVPHTVIADNAGGHLMQHDRVDLCIVGADRVTAQGDVANKIGTYLKALAARDNGVPFYVALPSPTIDFSLRDGVAEIPIEERAAEEVTHITGATADGRIERVRIVPEGSRAANSGFRRDAGAARHRAHHRARGDRGDASGAGGGISGARRRRRRALPGVTRPQRINAMPGRRAFAPLPEQSADRVHGRPLPRARHSAIARTTRP